jgi:hypothetical protein
MKDKTSQIICVYLKKFAPKSLVDNWIIFDCIPPLSEKIYHYKFNIDEKDYSIYDIEIGTENVVIKMTFTSPTCPMMEELLAQVRDAVTNVAGDVPVRVDLVWDPPWDLSRMSDAARLELDLTNQGW